MRAISSKQRCPALCKLRKAASLIRVFYKQEYKIFEIAHSFSRKISLFMCKSSVHFIAPSPPLSVTSAPSLRLLWRRQ